MVLFFPILALAALININTADSVELDKIPEVGPATAAKIIAYREANGPFKTIEEIKNVSGIGDATFLKMKDFITVGSTGGDFSTSTDQVVATTSLGVGGSVSAHLSQAELSDYAIETAKIGAGRKRLAVVGGPIVFAINASANNEVEKQFVWSFGDGTSAMGDEVRHVYQFPGTYNVVLNGQLSNDQNSKKFVSRTVVLVTEAKVKLVSFNCLAGYVELANNSEQEQNLTGWQLEMATQKYRFPDDTIINAQTTLKFPLLAMGFNCQPASDLTLSYPDGTNFSKLKLKSLQRQLATKTAQVDLPEAPEVKSQTPQVVALGAIKPQNVVVLTKEPSWFEKIKHALFQ